MEELYNKFDKTSHVKSLGWGSIDSQELRFKILMDLHEFNKNDTVLDVGCGYGDLSKYIENYQGIDIRQSAIDRAKMLYNRDFIVSTIFDITNNYDWVFASGIFAFNEDKWIDNVTNTISCMFKLCNKGIAFNMLSDLTPFKRDLDMKYVKLCDIFPLITDITHKFAIRHDYLKNDFTVYMYK